MIGKLKCGCNKECTVFHDLGTNSMIYSCKGTRHPKANKKILYDEEFPSIFCEFKKIIKPDNPSTYLEPEKSYNPDKYVPIVPKNKNLWIIPTVQFFLDNKLPLTFRELEIHCKQHNVDQYDETKETMYEYTQRIKKEFLRLGEPV